jgi:Flp pilus assembly protein TadD
MARLLSRTEDWQQAAWYYHRALYGEWKGAPDLRPLRFELANMLARHKAREQLVAEVVLLDAETAEPPEAKDLAQLELAAGEWDRAERHYRKLLVSNPNDPHLLAGLARALFGSGRYIAAERSFRRAAGADASDPAVQKELDLVARVNSLDPTLRRLAPSERHRRAHELVSMLLATLRKCSPESPLLTGSDQDLQDHQRNRNLSAIAEADLDLFEFLWAARDQVCRPGTKLPDTLELLAAQLTK